jgi:multidrug efflux pump subunit AcrA (membrane-fusion protein)
LDNERNRKSRRIATFGALIILLLASNFATWYLTKRAKTQNSTGTPTIKTSTVLQAVSTGTISRTVTTTGTVEPGNSANVNFAVSGRVNAVDVTVGQSVTSGQPLATIDSTTLAATLNLDQATLANDEAQLATDNVNSASAQQIASDNAAIASAQTIVNNAQTSLSDATLAAPIAGTVTAVNLSVGQQVSGNGTSASTGGGGASGAGNSSATNASASSSVQFSIIATNSYTVSASVTSAQVGQIQSGEQATITVPGSTTTAYGVVSTVGLVATTTSGVSSFPVTISVTGTPSGLYSGLSADVSIVTQVVQNAILVPSTALSVTGTQEVVSLDQNGNKVPTVVTTGVTSGGQTQILSGVSAGQKIWVTQLTINGVAVGAGARARRAGFGGAGGFGGFGGAGSFGGGLG